MGTYFTGSGFSSCEVGGFIAAALLHDLRVNNFTFTNFPEVDVSWDDTRFFIKLRAHGAGSSTFSLDYETVEKEIRSFRNRHDVAPEVLKIVQDHAAELEAEVARVS